MEEDEYDDELPPISVNCSSKEVSVFSMPSAEVLASQRAREEECERELRQMREQHEKQEAAFAAVANGDPTLPSRSNSSSSEGEAALTSAVEALRVGNSPVNGVQRPAAGELLGSVLAQLPAGARAVCQDYRDALLRGSARDIDTLTDDLITGIGSWLCGFDMETRSESSGEESADTSPENSPSDDEVLGVGAWLSAAVLWRAPSAQRARARRALHALLAAARDPQVSKLSVVLVRALRCARWRLALGAALCAGGRAPRAAALAAALARASLTHLLSGTQEADDEAPDACNLGPLSLPELAELARRGWRGVAAPQREVALQLLGRALHAAKLAEAAGQDGPPAPTAGQDVPQAPTAGQDVPQAPTAGQDVPKAPTAGQDGPRAPTAGQDEPQAPTARQDGPQVGPQAALAAALTVLAQPLAATSQDRHQPDYLKIAAAASKLQILLSDRN